MTEPADITRFGEDEYDELIAELESAPRVISRLREAARAPRRFVRDVVNPGSSTAPPAEG